MTTHHATLFALIVSAFFPWGGKSALGAETSELLGVVQAENFLRQQGSRGTADVDSAVGGKVLGYEFGRHKGHQAEYKLTARAAAKPGLLWFRTARQYPEPATWEVYLDGRRLPGDVKLATTGSWFISRWSSVALPEITKGQHTLKIVAGHADANVNFDMMAFSSAGVRPPEELSAMGTPPDAKTLGGRIVSLQRAAEHLAAKYPGVYDKDGSLRGHLEKLKKRPADAHVAAELESLSRRILLEENPLLRSASLLFVRRQSLGWGGGHYAYNETLSWFREQAPGHRVFNPGSSLCVLSPPWSQDTLDVLLDSPTGVIRDPEVHFDGNRVLFAHKKNLDEDDYHLYEIDTAAGGVRTLTADAGFADYEGCYLPDGNIMFSSTRCVQTVDCFPTPVSNLYLMDSGGGNVRRATVNHVHDNSPSVLADGRVVFTRWEYNDRWVLHVQGLAVVNPDGTGGRALYGNNSFWPISMLHARAIPGSDKIVCTLSGHHSVDQCGEIGIFDTSLGTEEAAGCVHLWPPRKIEPIRDEMYWRKLPALYQYPYPLSEHFFLVACKPKGQQHYGIYLIDTFGNRQLIHREPGISCVSPMPLRPRPKPPVIPSRVRYGEDNATVCLVDVYRGSGMRGVPRGEVEALRIVELINRPMGNRQWAGMDGTPPMGLNSSWDAKRVVGTVPVDDDGSAVFRVPAATALYFQPLDARGRAIQWERSWVTLQPGEVRSCVGCHDAKDRTPALAVGRMQEALARTPLVPDAGWCATERPLNFHQDVQPVLDAACIECHDQGHPRGIDLRADKTDGFSLGYENLRPWVKVSGTRGGPPKIAPKSVGAIASPLIAMLEKGHNRVTLAPEQMSRLVTWIDVGAPYYGTYALSRYDAPFGRCIVRDAGPLWRALGDACGECHKPSNPPSLPEQAFGRTRKGRGFSWREAQRYDTTNAVLVNLTHPEQSRLLRGPLAKDSGGLALCGGFEFSTTADPRYRAALAVIEGWSRELQEKPREDMPGSTPCAEYTVWWKKRLESEAIERSSRRALSDSSQFE